MLHRLPLAAIATLLLSLTACHTAHLETPDGFAELDDGHYDYRATSSAGVVVGVKSHENKPRGSLDFWSGVVTRKLEDQGYTRVDAKPRTVKSESGVEGRQVRYTFASGGRPHQYWLTLFVTSTRVFVVEAGGDEAFFDKDIAPKVEAAIASLKTG